MPIILYLGTGQKINNEFDDSGKKAAIHRKLVHGPFVLLLVFFSQFERHFTPSFSVGIPRWFLATFSRPLVGGALSSLTMVARAHPGYTHYAKSKKGEDFEAQVYDRLFVRSISG
jgi:hypothetical protein